MRNARAGQDNFLEGTTVESVMFEKKNARPYTLNINRCAFDYPQELVNTMTNREKRR